MSVWGTDKITLIGTRELKELRELNAELLGILKHIISSYELTDSDLSESESAIAKAEKHDRGTT